MTFHRLFVIFLFFLLEGSFRFAASTDEITALVKRNSGPNTIFTPPSTNDRERSLYARHILLSDGTILATADNYVHGTKPPSFPVFQSRDKGVTWKQIGKVEDKMNGWGMRLESQLYVLKKSYGKFKSGTILCAGNSIPNDFSKTKIDIYASRTGVDWTFVSSVAQGGRAAPKNGETPVWEPFILEYGGKVLVYYSDQRDAKKYGQKIVHQASSDLLTWSPVVEDVVTPGDRDARPGMPVVAALPNAQYIMTYELSNAPEAAFAVYYKIVGDPTKFNTATGQVLRTQDGHVFTSTPYVIWVPGSEKDSPNGVVVVSCFSTTDLLVNRAQGDPKEWKRLPVPNSIGAYSRSLAVGFTPNEVTIADGGLPDKGPTNKVTFMTVDVDGCEDCGAKAKAKAKTMARVTKTKQH